MRYQLRPAPVACHARIWVADDQTTDSPIIFSWFSNDKDTVHNTELTRFILHPNVEPYPRSCPRVTVWSIVGTLGDVPHDIMTEGMTTLEPT